MPRLQNTPETRKLNAEYQHKWYLAHKREQMDRNKVRRERLRQWFNELRATKVCVNCGEDNPACLDFHHVDPDSKIAPVTHMIRRVWSMTKILEELDKCVVLCSNCHRKLHSLGR